MQPKLGQAFSLACLIEFGPPSNRPGSSRSAWPFSVRRKALLSPEFLGLVDHAFFRCPFASIDESMTTWSPRLAQGISEADINNFLGCMAQDHTHAKAADNLKKGKYTTGWIYCFH